MPKINNVSRLVLGLDLDDNQYKLMHLSVEADKAPILTKIISPEYSFFSVGMICMPDQNGTAVPYIDFIQQNFVSTTSPNYQRILFVDCSRAYQSDKSTYYEFGELQIDNPAVSRIAVGLNLADTSDQELQAMQVQATWVNYNNELARQQFQVQALQIEHLARLKLERDKLLAQNEAQIARQQTIDALDIAKQTMDSTQRTNKRILSAFNNFQNQQQHAQPAVTHSSDREAREKIDLLARHVVHLHAKVAQNAEKPPVVVTQPEVVRTEVIVSDSEVTLAKLAQLEQSIQQLSAAKELEQTEAKQKLAQAEELIAKLTSAAVITQTTTAEPSVQAQVQTTIIKTEPTYSRFATYTISAINSSLKAGYHALAARAATLSNILDRHNLSTQQKIEFKAALTVCEACVFHLLNKFNDNDYASSASELLVANILAMSGIMLAAGHDTAITQVPVQTQEQQQRTKTKKSKQNRS